MVLSTVDHTLCYPPQHLISPHHHIVEHECIMSASGYPQGPIRYPPYHDMLGNGICTDSGDMLLRGSQEGSTAWSLGCSDDDDRPDIDDLDLQIMRIT